MRISLGRDRLGVAVWQLALAQIRSQYYVRSFCWLHDGMIRCMCAEMIGENVSFFLFKLWLVRWSVIVDKLPLKMFDHIFQAIEMGHRQLFHSVSHPNHLLANRFTTYRKTKIWICDAIGLACSMAGANTHLSIRWTTDMHDMWLAAPEAIASTTSVCPQWRWYYCMPSPTYPSSRRIDPVPFSGRRFRRQSRTHDKCPLAAYPEPPLPRRIVVSQTEWRTDVSSPPSSDRTQIRHEFSSNRAHTWPAPVLSIYCAQWIHNLRISLLGRWIPTKNSHKIRTAPNRKVNVNVSRHFGVNFVGIILPNSVPWTCGFWICAISDRPPATHRPLPVHLVWRYSWDSHSRPIASSHCWPWERWAFAPRCIHCFARRFSNSCANRSIALATCVDSMSCMGSVGSSVSFGSSSIEWLAPHGFACRNWPGHRRRGHEYFRSAWNLPSENDPIPIWNRFCSVWCDCQTASKAYSNRWRPDCVAPNTIHHICRPAISRMFCDPSRHGIRSHRNLVLHRYPFDGWLRWAWVPPIECDTLKRDPMCFGGTRKLSNKQLINENSIFEHSHSGFHTLYGSDGDDGSAVAFDISHNGMGLCAISIAKHAAHALIAANHTEQWSSKASLCNYKYITYTCMHGIRINKLSTLEFCLATGAVSGRH